MSFAAWLRTATDTDCKNKAAEIARYCSDFAEQGFCPLRYAISAGYFEDTGLNFDTPTEAQQRGIDKLVRRVQSAKWWTGQLTRRSIREREKWQLIFGHVGTHGAYLSGAALERMIVRKQRSDAAIADAVCVSPDGEVIDLKQIIDASMANPKNRRLELVVRMKGIAEWAQRGGYVAYAVTLTAPSKYHRMTTAGTDDKKYLIENPKWDANEYTPKDTAKYLGRQWAQYRALMKKDDIEVVGLRTCEPHKDGTPHWHTVLFFKKKDVRKALKTLRAKFLEVDGKEKGAQKRRVLIERIKPKKGQDMVYAAVAYAIGYISKNLDGNGLDTDTEAGTSAVNGAQRATAWARVWGIRQFQTFGAPSITVWRELRKIRDEAMKAMQEAAKDKNAAIATAAQHAIRGNIQPMGLAALQAMKSGNKHLLAVLTSMRDLHVAGGIKSDGAMLGEAWKAADKGQFRRFIVAMKKTKVELMKREQVNGYGETVEVISGVRGGGHEVITRQEGWSIKWGAKGSKVLAAQPRKGEAKLAPRTCGTNCNQAQAKAGLTGYPVIDYAASDAQKQAAAALKKQKREAEFIAAAKAAKIGEKPIRKNLNLSRSEGDFHRDEVEYNIIRLTQEIPREIAERKKFFNHF